MATALSEQAALADEAILKFIETVDWANTLPALPSEESTMWLTRLPGLIAQTRAKHEARKLRGLKRIDSLEVCPICYAEAIDTRFLPCQHTSCADCIARHLLNSKRCFFCNTAIESTEKISK